MWVAYTVLVVAIALFAWDIVQRLWLADERTVLAFAALTAALGAALGLLWAVHP